MDSNGGVMSKMQGTLGGARAKMQSAVGGKIGLLAAADSYGGKRTAKLKVTVVEAMYLAKTGGWSSGPMSPCCAVAIGPVPNRETKTDTIKDTADPEWHQVSIVAGSGFCQACVA